MSPRAENESIPTPDVEPGIVPVKPGSLESSSKPNASTLLTASSVSSQDHTGTDTPKCLQDGEPTVVSDCPDPATETKGEEQSKRGDDSVAPVPDAQEPAKDSGDKDSSAQKAGWNLAATLYCSVNGHPHSNLLNFDIDHCPSCAQSLARMGPPPKSTSLPVDGKDSKKEKENEKESEENKSPISLTPDTEELQVQHAVQYRDVGGHHIETADWEHPFELEKERGNSLRKKSTVGKNVIFKVITVLRTTLPTDSRGFMVEEGILGNPRISVSVQSVELVIQSPLFIDALKAVATYDTGDLLDTTTLELCEPYPLICHHLDQLETYMRKIEPQPETDKTTNSAVQEGVAAAGATTKAGPSPERETHAHMNLVLDFVRRSLSEPIAQELARYQQATPTCTFRMLWFLLRPERPVYVMSDGVADAFMIGSIDTGDYSLSCPFEYLKPCRVTLWYFDFNGQHITRVRSDVTIQPFNGEKSIMSLNVMPCDMLDKQDKGVLRKQLVARGKKWVGHLLGKQVEYSGEPPKHGEQTPEGRAYVDYSSYYAVEECDKFVPLVQVDNDEDEEACKCASCRKQRQKTHPVAQRAEYDRIDVKKDDQGASTLSLPPDQGASTASLPPDQVYLLSSRQLKAFMFSTRRWETLDVRYCQPSTPNKNPFSRLVMPEDRKLMIKALVYKYTDPRYAGGNPQQVWGADYIRNKGEGQVFLLHGGPGVGKTFTAECIAEFTGRPMLALTCGDMGTEPVEMERKLRDWLKLAHKWGAVMLIDEADVFLEKRMDTDVKRNSLVSVFLREIEYYQGILFLTSNRVGRFDDAFISRIHVVIHYRDLDDDYRRKIWNQFFDKLEAERGDMMKIEKSAKRYVLEDPRILEIKWNGREIRNAFQTAVALAEYRFLTKPKEEKGEGEIAVLEESDFRQICDMTVKFKQYMTDLAGADEQTRAQLDKNRV